MNANSSHAYRLVIEGVQTVRNIQTTCDRLGAAIAEHQTIVVDCEGVSELDVSLIQLLLAAKSTADKKGKTLELAAPVSGELRAALDRAGFLVADQNEAHAAMFWLKGIHAV